MGWNYYVKVRKGKRYVYAQRAAYKNGKRTPETKYVGPLGLGRGIWNSHEIKTAVSKAVERRTWADSMKQRRTPEEFAKAEADRRYWQEVNAPKNPMREDARARAEREHRELAERVKQETVPPAPAPNYQVDEEIEVREAAFERVVEEYTTAANAEDTAKESGGAR